MQSVGSGLSAFAPSLLPEAAMTASELALLPAASTAGAAASGATGTASTLSGLGSGLSSLGGLAAIPAAVIGVMRGINEFVNTKDKAKRKAQEFRRLQSGFQTGWPELHKSADVMEGFNRLDLLGGDERNRIITQGLDQSRSSLRALPDAERYLAELQDTKGGEQAVKPYYEALPKLKAQSYMGQLKGIDAAHNAGLSYGEVPSLTESLIAMHGLSGTQNFFPQGVPDRSRAEYLPRAQGGEEEASVPNPEYHWYQENPNPITMQDIPSDLSGQYTPGNLYPSVEKILRKYSPGFDQSAVGQVLGGFGSTDPGRLSSLPASEAPIAQGSEGVTRRGVGTDQRQVSAIPDLTVLGGRAEMDSVLNKSKAFLGST
jgi:hypothetical protein